MYCALYSEGIYVMKNQVALHILHNSMFSAAICVVVFSFFVRLSSIFFFNFVVVVVATLLALMCFQWFFVLLFSAFKCQRVYAMCVYIWFEWVRECPWFGSSLAIPNSCVCFFCVFFFICRSWKIAEMKIAKTHRCTHVLHKGIACARNGSLSLSLSAVVSCA